MIDPMETNEPDSDQIHQSSTSGVATEQDQILRSAAAMLLREQEQKMAVHRQEQKLAEQRPWWDGACYWIKVNEDCVAACCETGEIGEFKTEEEARQFATRHWELHWKYQEQTRLHDLSKIEFRSQHWWGDGRIFRPYRKGGKIQRKMHVHEAKAALIYEAYRRRPEVQQAWLEGKLGCKANGWQHFTAWVVQYLPLSWPELKDLHPIVTDGVIDTMLCPWFMPPLGYSTFPDKSMPEKCEEATIMKLPRLDERNDPVSAQNFVEYLKRFEDAGFIFVAIDHKSSQRDKYALNALRKLLADLPPTFRKQDLRTLVQHHLPSNISKSDRQALEEKERQGTLTEQDCDEVRSKYRKPNYNLNAPWTATATYYAVPTGKRKGARPTRKYAAAFSFSQMFKFKCNPVLLEEKRFDFPKLFAELADLDDGKIQQSDFVQRVRL